MTIQIYNQIIMILNLNIRVRYCTDLTKVRGVSRV